MATRKSYSNPLRAINGKAVKCPSVYKYNLQDVSASDAGRTEDTRMDKMRVGQCVKIECEWRNITVAECSAILQAVDGEYMMLDYLDLKKGGFRTSEFYIGDRSAPLYNAKLGIVNNLSFNFIERSGV